MRWTLIALVAGVLAVGGWFAAERRYENCLDDAIAENPLSPSAADRRAEGQAFWDSYSDDEDKLRGADLRALLARIEDRPRRRREAALDACSRLPL
jgi:hypothetical protein